MLGYVKKSKVSSANSAANSLQKAINTALVEIDEESQEAGSITAINRSGRSGNVSISGKPSGVTEEAVTNKIMNYMEKARKLAFVSSCDGGVCRAVAVAVDDTYTGTSPSGVVTVDNYKTYSGISNLDDALAGAVAKAS